MKAEIWRGALNGARIGFLAGLGLAALYLVIYALGDTELDKSLGYSLLLVAFPTLFAVVPALQWLGLQGGSDWVGVVLLPLTLSLNTALWGAVIGVAVTVGKRIRPR